MWRVANLTQWSIDIIGSVLPFQSPARILHLWIRLGTIFYLGYLAFEIPQNLALQRFPVGKWMRLAAHTLHGAPFSEVIPLVLIYSSGVLLYVAMRLARTLPVSS